MLTDITLLEDLGFSIWLWSAGQLNIFLLNSYVAVLSFVNSSSFDRTVILLHGIPCKSCVCVQ